MKAAPVCALFVACLVSGGVPLPGAAQEEATPRPSALQVMADAVLIDARCRDLTIDFGAVLRFGADHGITGSAIMPLGALRQDFEAAFARRAASIDPETLCTVFAAQEDDLTPGLIRHP